MLIVLKVSSSKLRHMHGKHSMHVRYSATFVCITEGFTISFTRQYDNLQTVNCLAMRSAGKIQNSQTLKCGMI